MKYAQKMEKYFLVSKKKDNLTLYFGLHFVKALWSLLKGFEEFQHEDELDQ